MNPANALAVFSIVLILAATTGRADSLCSAAAKAASSPVAFADARADVEKRVEIFAGKKVIAEKADAMLSKLLSAGSPVIKSWMKTRDLDQKSEDEIVRQWRVYFAKNFILSKYPSEDKAVDAESEKLVDGILESHVRPEFREKMETLFSRSQKASVETIKTFKLKDEKSVLDRISKVKLYWPPNLKSARNGAVPLEIIDWGIAYDPVPNEINMGLNALAYSNEETYLAVFAHEIGHAFDSCRWGAFFTGSWPFEKVGKCLRSQTSVGAKKRDDSRMGKMTKNGDISAELATSLWQNPTCNKREYPPIGVQADQLPESFADWFSSEVVRQISGLDAKKLRTDLCQKKSLIDGSSYPSNELRLSKIYHASTATRCSFK